MFPSELYAWLSRLAGNTTFSPRLIPTEWTLEAIQRLERTYNSISSAVDYWLNSLLDGFVIEFAVDTLKAYNQAKCYFFKGYRGKYLKSLSLSINMLLCEKERLRIDAL